MSLAEKPRPISTFDAANAALKETRKQFPFGSSNIAPIQHHPLSDKIIFHPTLFAKNASTKSIDALVDDKIIDIAKKRIKKIRMDMIQLIQDTEGMDVNLRRHTIRSILAKKAAAYGAGNCEELATFAFLSVIENGYPGKVEFVTFKDTDHLFVILNRSADSDPKNWKSWNADTVILDPWINKVFSVSQLGKIWKENPWHVDSNNLQPIVKFDDTVFRNVSTNTKLKSQKA